MGKDWIPCEDYGVATRIAVAGLAPGSNRTFLFPLFWTGLDDQTKVGSPDTDPDHLTIHRVVGQVEVACRDFVSANYDYLLISQRLTVGHRDDFGLVTAYTTELANANDANELFMHERRFSIENGESNLDMFADPAHANWDVRSKRRLSNAEAVILVVEVAWTAELENAPPTITLDADIYVRPFLRAYATY